MDLAGLQSSKPWAKLIDEFSHPQFISLEIPRLRIVPLALSVWVSSLDHFFSVGL